MKRSLVVLVLDQVGRVVLGFIRIWYVLTPLHIAFVHIIQYEMGMVITTPVFYVHCEPNVSGKTLRQSICHNIFYTGNLPPNREICIKIVFRNRK